MSDDLVHILERGYAVMWHERRVEDSVRALGDDFEWIVPGHPEGDVRRGAEGVAEFVREWIEPWEDMEVEWDLQQVGADQVLAIIDMRGRGRESGVPAEMHFAQLWTFRDGRAVRMAMYYDMDEARRAAGLDP
jgi:ketosteroid isomerase-like protein